MALHHPEPAWPSEIASKAFVECWNGKRIVEYKRLGGTAASKEAMRVRLLDALIVELWANSTWPRAVRCSFTTPKVTLDRKRIPIGVHPEDSANRSGL